MSKKIVLMPRESEVAALTSRAALIEQEIAALERELREIEARLEAYALAHAEQHEPLEDAERQGTRLKVPGAVIRFESDQLITSFEEGSAKHEELYGLADSRLSRLFDAPCMWTRVVSDGKKFRALVREELAPSTAAAFLAACRAVDKAGIPKSRTVFEYSKGSAQAGKPATQTGGES
jgi:hypothetical protein